MFGMADPEILLDLSRHNPKEIQPCTNSMKLN